MRITLDYYRILGVPPQASLDQIGQAHADRSRQLPRREYSQGAIAARKQLLDRAYEVLSDSDGRAQYDQELLGSEPEGSSPAEPWPSLEIPSEQAMGALLILQELGEYELTLRLANDLLNDLPARELTLRADLTLTLALAHLELSREQWQQGNYEQAALAGRQGLGILERAPRFEGVREEIRTELYRLRPYRILDLLACEGEARRKGWQLLQEMLQARQGIEGKGDDGSGLGPDDFLRFIQQARSYLSAAEQQELFEAEAARPSAAGSYLAAYAAMARGFAEKKPSEIVRAREILNRLSQRQDVNLELGICALLLGQTEAARLAMEGCQDEGVLAFIREQSRGAPDLLPGLCRQCERWLQTEVFPHYRDLAAEPVSLQDYFADGTVQRYLELLPAESLAAELDPCLEPEATLAHRISQTRRAAGQGKAVRTRQSVSGRSRYREVPALANGTDGVAVALAPSRTKRPRPKRTSLPGDGSGAPAAPASPPPPAGGKEASPPSQPRRKRKVTFKPKPLFLALVALGSLGIASLSVQLFRQAGSPAVELRGEQLSLDLGQPPLEILPADAYLLPPTGPLTPEGALDLVQVWLERKSRAFGSTHQVDHLTPILADPLLSDWRRRALALKRSQDYWQYRHEVKIESLKTNPRHPDRASVEAQVREVASYYQNGRMNRQRSYDDRLRVRYDLVRENDRWLIERAEILG